MTKENINSLVQKRIKRGIYNLFGINDEHKVVIKGSGMIDLGHEESVCDAMIERFTISPNVFGELYKCNIVDSFLMSSKKQPLMYIAVVYEKPLVRSVLFSLFLYFTITSEIKSQDQLVGTELEGSFTIELILDKETKVLDTTFSEKGYPGKAKTIDNLKTMVMSSDLQPIIQNIIKKKNDERREHYLNMFPGGNFSAPPKVTVKLDD
jgi:hypothetical protein